MTDPSGNVTQWTYDLLNRVQAETNQLGKTLSYVYDAVGNVVSETDAAIAHLYGYTGREWDEAIDLQYNRARYYDPTTARFTATDPLSFAAGDTNLYRMVGNHPTYATDPSGLEFVLPFETVQTLLGRHDRRGTLTEDVRLVM